MKIKTVFVAIMRTSSLVMGRVQIIVMLAGRLQGREKGCQ